jgi:hypothetical protein
MNWLNDLITQAFFPKLVSELEMTTMPTNFIYYMAYHGIKK